MDIVGDIKLDPAGKIYGATIAEETNFPTNPIPGRFMFKDKQLWFCTKIENELPVWVPCSHVLSMYKHVQNSSALEWSIPHNLNCSQAVVQIFDSSNFVVIPDKIDCSEFNTTLVSFSIPIAGVAIVLAGNREGTAPPYSVYEQSFTNQATWTINHNLGYNPIVRVIVGQNEVQPSSITYPSLNQAIVTFSSPQTGSVRCI